MKNLLSRLLAAALCAMLLLTAVPFASAETELIQIEPTFLAMDNKTMNEWYSTDANRTAYATYAIFDMVYSNTLTDPYVDAMSEAMKGNSVYVAFTDTLLIAYYFGSELTVVFYYNPIGYASYDVIEFENGTSMGGMMMDALKDAGSFGSYYHVDADAMREIYQTVLGE